jgi:hypothetical protein
MSRCSFPQRLLLVRVAAALAGLSCALLVPRAYAGLRPMYGGELIVWAPGMPQVTEPARAWSSVEVLLAHTEGYGLESWLDGPPEVSGASVRFDLRPDAIWRDGTPVEGGDLALRLAQSLAQSRVALPPFNFHANGREVIADLPTPLVSEESYVLLPWLRPPAGQNGSAYRIKKGAYEADPRGAGGRPFADRVRVEVRQGARLDVPADGLALAQSGGDGRPVFALVEPGSPSRGALAAALTTLDRASLAKYFIRSPAHIPEGWSIPAAPAMPPPDRSIVLAVDASEHDLETVAERLQILLRDQQIDARIVAEDRNAHWTRLTGNQYDLAVVALPPAPRLVQAATLLRLLQGRDAPDHFWVRPDVAEASPQDPAMLKKTADALGAVLLYMEDGNIVYGSHVRAPFGAPLWQIDPAELWLSAGGSPP